MAPKKKPVPRGRAGGRKPRGKKPATERVSVNVSKDEKRRIARACAMYSLDVSKAVRALPALLDVVSLYDPLLLEHIHDGTLDLSLSPMSEESLRAADADRGNKRLAPVVDGVVQYKCRVPGCDVIVGEWERCAAHGGAGPQ